ncbi:hypothetical protein QKU48_gp0493 [Fadolivirus algeromassiliense]|jgi:hypothetical protein|uniref:Uncharacterized protein n=1 Tax=Fadolivirus FV1/VV64 TaxID=3070911 RepID=A0A7D3UU73_9VIRU|nr:hypothetical protein QKU48_gp0493 [Fadolivirus algeromassiliense]QKF93951.1 hypothetical protein Fadolivirus_1_493 [Fadolivirus FV1/VV64]
MEYCACIHGCNKIPPKLILIASSLDLIKLTLAQSANSNSFYDLIDTVAMEKWELNDDGTSIYEEDANDNDENSTNEDNEDIIVRKYQFHINNNEYKLLLANYYPRYKDFRCLCSCQITIIKFKKTDVLDISLLEDEIEVY